MHHYIKPTLVFLLLLILVIPTSISLFLPGFPTTHDGLNHVLRQREFYQALLDGQLPPRWAGGLNWDFGSPAIMYYGYLPYLLGSILKFLGLSFAQSIKLLWALSFISSALFFYFWLKDSLGKLPALIGALVYTWAPYRFVDIYVRGAFPESLVFTFLPLLFWSVDSASKGKKTLSLITGTLGVMCLMLTHTVVGAVFIIISFAYAAIEAYLSKKIEVITRTIINILFGLSLSAFFWVPATLESNLINLTGQLSKWRFQDNFVPLKDLLYSHWGWGPLHSSSPMSLQFGTIQWLILFLTLISLLLGVRGKNIWRLRTLFFFLITIASLILILPQSSLIWNLHTPINYFLYPWRYLTLAIFSVAFLSSVLISRIPYKYLISILLVVILIYSNRNHTQLVGTIPDKDDYYSVINDSSDIDGEFLPVTANRELIPLCRNTNCKFSPISTIPGSKYSIVSNKSNILVVNTNNPNSIDLDVNRFYFPGWNVFLDGKLTTFNLNNNGGVHVSIPQGEHELTLKWSETNIRTGFNFISFLGFLAFLIYLIFLQVKPNYLSKR